MSESVTDTKRIARQIPEDVATAGDLDLLDDVVREDAVEHTGVEGDLVGREAIREQMRRIRTAFPDFSATVEDVVAEGDRVAMRVTLRGTHEGPFMGVEPTGRAFEVGNQVITRIEDGMIAERWIQPDLLSMFQQLGVLPEDLSAVAAPDGD